uniref:Uncharacterized protein n=1 Tax=Cacopsylla melanoneura TaxID=428564 RepID=A0A8D9BNE5_9HEMI
MTCVCSLHLTVKYSHLHFMGEKQLPLWSIKFTCLWDCSQNSRWEISSIWQHRNVVRLVDLDFCTHSASTTGLRPLRIYILHTCSIFYNLLYNTYVYTALPCGT